MNCRLAWSPDVEKVFQLASIELLVSPGAGKTLMEYTMRLYAIQAGPRGINVNCILPGVIISDAWRKYSTVGGGPDDNNVAEAIGRRVPMQHPGRPRNIADAVNFLCSEKGAYITGVALPVDGGRHLGLDHHAGLPAAAPKAEK